jgi:hypothetical protein
MVYPKLNPIMVARKKIKEVEPINDYDITTPEDVVDSFEMCAMGETVNYVPKYYNRYLRRVFGAPDARGEALIEVMKRHIFSAKTIIKDLGWTYDESRTELGLKQMRFEAVEELVNQIKNECNQTVKLVAGCKNTTQMMDACKAYNILRRRKGAVDLDLTQHSEILPVPDSSETPF